MSRFWQKIKATLKILIGVTVLYLLGTIFAIVAILLSGAGVISLAIGVLIMAGAVAIGAYLGGMWSAKNIVDVNNVRGIAVWSAVIFFVVQVIFFLVGSALLVMAGEAREGFVMQTINIIIQSFMIYIVSQLGMRRRLIKK